MKRSRNVLMICVAAVAMWVTAGCGRRAVDLMDRADALLDDRPDSAKVLLEQINPDRFLCPGRRARYTVLATTARERTTMDPKVSEEERRDTLLRAALEWYELHPNRRPKDYMRALYYYGYRQHRLKDYSTAIYYLTRAQEWSEKLDNPFYSGMAFREIGSAYLLSFNYPEAIENEKKAIAVFEKAGKPLHAADAKKAMARAYYSSGDFTQAQKLYEQVLEVYQDSVFRSQALVSLAQALILQSPDNADRAIQLIEESVSLGNTLWMDGWGVLAEAYAIIGDYSKADSALFRRKQLANTALRKNNLNYVESRVARAKGDYRTAYEKEEAFRMGMQQLNLHGQAESIMAVQRNYYKGLHDAEITRVRTRKWKIGGQVALFIMVIGLLFSMYNRQRRRRIEDQKIYFREMEEASSLAQNLKRQIENSHLIGHKWEKIMKTIETVISLSCEEYGADAQKSARKLRDDFRSGKYNQDLMALADAISQNAVTNLKKEVRQKKGTLEEEDYLLYALWIDGLTNTAMSHLFKSKRGNDLQVNALYVRKNRLKSKLEDILGEEADKFISILQ